MTAPAAPAAPPPTVVDTSRSRRARLQSVPLTAVTLADGFWTGRLRTVREVTLRQQLEQCEATGRIDHFRRASGRKEIEEFVGRFYDDSDVYKWLEAAAYALATNEDAALAQLVDGVVDEIAAAQGSDGYLNTYFTFEREAERWSNMTRMHQLYCAGHLIQAAIALHRATGKETLLGVATRFADLICETFGPHNPNTDGHEEIELALVELYRHTRERRYLDQALFFLDVRGRKPPVLDGSVVFQDHLPVRQQHEIVGHAVRATYLAIGMADVHAETGDAGLWEAVQQLWASAFERKAYVTGGLGARWQGEAFGADYELPNERAYAETCAAIGGFMWNWRMLLLTGEARYADWMETALYNGILSGLSLDGSEYFYQNPLANDGTHRRQPWFGTACCPPNIARLLLALPGYLYGTSSDAADGIWVHHYVPGELRFTSGGATGTLKVETEYPWDGKVRLTLAAYEPAAEEGAEKDAEWTLHLRIPAWTERPHLNVNDVAVAGLEPGRYAAVARVWKEGDVLELDLPMPIHRVRAHPRLASNAGRVALQRGPLVYCLEGTDHAGTDLRDVELPPDADLHAERVGDLLGGVQVVRGHGTEVQPVAWDGYLYGWGHKVARRRAVELTAVPYYAWANRAPGQMQVWIKEG